jgi:hypothetical protein
LGSLQNVHCLLRIAGVHSGRKLQLVQMV